MNDNTLMRLNRQHDTACVRQATEALSSRGIITCGHVILGLPQESEDDMLLQARLISRLPIQILKIHQLQVLRGTALAKSWEREEFRVSTADEYLSLLAQYICRLRSDLVLERFFSSSPLQMVIAPQWGIRPGILNQKLTELMLEKGWRQGVFALP
jgi:radical SAM superfamily enzyme